MENSKKNSLFLWIAIVLLAGNLIMLSLIWIKPSPNNNAQTIIKDCTPQQAGRNNFEHRIARELQLDQKQLDKYHELKKAHMVEMWNLRDSIRQHKLLIHQELMKENPDLNRINQLSDSIGVINAKFEKLNYNHFFELKKELNPEQIVKFRELIEHLPYFGNNNYKQNNGRHRNRR